MRAAETRALADEMKEAEPKAIMLRIAADYEKLAEWADKSQHLGGTKNKLRANKRARSTPNGSRQVSPRCQSWVKTLTSISRRRSFNRRLGA